jgi:hypothetical protein
MFLGALVSGVATSAYLVTPSPGVEIVPDAPKRKERLLLSWQFVYPVFGDKEMEGFSGLFFLEPQYVVGARELRMSSGVRTSIPLAPKWAIALDTGLVAGSVSEDLSTMSNPGIVLGAGVTYKPKKLPMITVTARQVMALDGPRTAVMTDWHIPFWTSEWRSM